jgi:hypothetical protein
MSTSTVNTDTSSFRAATVASEGCVFSAWRWLRGGHLHTVIARSEATKQFRRSHRTDCFAELVIGPATSGRTRWLAMTKEYTLEFPFPAATHAFVLRSSHE